MKDEICALIASKVARYLTDGEPLDEAVLAHVKECSACSVALQRARTLGELLAESGVAAVGDEEKFSPRLTREVAAAVKRRRNVRLALGSTVLIVGSVLWFSIRNVPNMSSPGIVWIVAMMLFTLPLLAAAATAGVDIGPARVYKRMRGRQLSGVCQGLSEAFSIPVWLLRMAFVAFIFAHGAGIVVYLILDSFMQIHPDDRSDLLRFRIARWWKRRFAAA